MATIYKTKKEILKLFVKGTPLTLTDISLKLDLAASTVNQHLTELKVLGAIEEVEHQGTRKWKYYKLNLVRSEELYNQWSINSKEKPATMYNNIVSWQVVKPERMTETA